MYYTPYCSRAWVLIVRLFSSAADQFPLDVQEAEEKFDLALIATLEIDVVPQLGDARVPDSVIVCYLHCNTYG